MSININQYLRLCVATQSLLQQGFNIDGLLLPLLN